MALPEFGATFAVVGLSPSGVSARSLRRGGATTLAATQAGVSFPFMEWPPSDLPNAVVVQLIYYSDDTLTFTARDEPADRNRVPEVLLKAWVLPPPMECLVLDYLQPSANHQDLLQELRIYVSDNAIPELIEPNDDESDWESEDFFAELTPTRWLLGRFPPYPVDEKADAVDFSEAYSNAALTEYTAVRPKPVATSVGGPCCDIPFFGQSGRSKFCPTCGAPAPESAWCSRCNDTVKGGIDTWCGSCGFNLISCPAAVQTLQLDWYSGAERRPLDMGKIYWDGLLMSAETQGRHPA
jgi:hypothetical protein